MFDRFSENLFQQMLVLDPTEDQAAYPAQLSERAFMS
jgi:hypothetical protein